VASGCPGRKVEGGVRGGEKCGYPEDGLSTFLRKSIHLNLSRSHVAVDRYIQCELLGAVG
jgi:hypothetical protein